MASVNRVLLVDDEPKIVDALQRLLRPLRETWSVFTATSAKAALELLDRDAFDVVVSDMRMPEMDGASFLAIVKEKFPAMARVILSGQTEKSAALRALPVAHQFLQKPCPPSTLIELLKRRADFTLVDVALRGRIGAIDSLPCEPDAARALTSLVESEKVKLSEITALVKSEPALVMKWLQLTGSSFFGVSRQNDDVGPVASVAGEELLQTLAASARASTETSIASKRFDFRVFRDHATAVASAAECALSGSPNRASSFAAGMLHEIGKLVIALHAPEQFDAVSERASADGISFEAAEVVEGVESHASVGASLLDLWGLPDSIVLAVARRSRTSDDDDLANAIERAHQREDRSAA